MYATRVASSEERAGSRIVRAQSRLSTAWPAPPTPLGHGPDQKSQTRPEHGAVAAA